MIFRPHIDTIVGEFKERQVVDLSRRWYCHFNSLKELQKAKLDLASTAQLKLKCCVHVTGGCFGFPSMSSHVNSLSSIILEALK